MVAPTAVSLSANPVSPWSEFTGRPGRCSQPLVTTARARKELAADAYALLFPAAHAKGLEFDVDAPDGEVMLTTDVAKARQILANLCGNAVKYTDEGGIRLRLTATEDRATFEVIDTGIGIAPENQGRVFERFWQVDGGTSRVAGGLGIGLSAARAYARLLGGDVVMESELGAGSTFRLWLPRDGKGAAEPAEKRDRRAGASSPR